MKRLFAIQLIGVLVIVMAGCGSPSTPSATQDTDLQTSAVSGGQVETAYPAVGCLQGSMLCTGTLIAPNLVVSAKHCGPMNTFKLGNSCNAPSSTRNVDAMFAFHPEEGTGPELEDMYTDDLAVYHLAEPIYNVRPLQINPGGYPANGTTCVSVGFGRDDSGVSGTKRSATVTVQWSGELSWPGWLGMYSAIEVAPGSPTASPPGGQVEKGDSGGPLLCNGSGVIMGVASGRYTFPVSGTYYTGIDPTRWSSAWVTNVASNYVNEPMVSATSWSANRFDLFVRGTDGAVYTKAYDANLPPAPDGHHWYPSMFGWSYLGGFITGTPEAISWGPGRIDVFMRGGDPSPQTNDFSSMSLWHLYWDGSGWHWRGPHSAGLASHPVAVTWGAPRLDVMAVASNGYLGHWYGNGQISAFQNIPTDGGPTKFLGPMKAISTNYGHFDLYAVGIDRMLYHNHYDSYTVGWTGWTNLGGEVRGTPAVTTWGGGRQDIFVKGTDTNVYHKVNFGGGSWYPSQQGFGFLGGPIDGSPAAASMQLNWLTLISNAPNGSDGRQIAYKAWFNGAQWYPTNTTWINLGGIANGAPTLLAAPGVGVNLFSVGGSFTPSISNYKPTGPQPHGWSAAGSLGGVISW